MIRNLRLFLLIGMIGACLPANAQKISDDYFLGKWSTNDSATGEMIIYHFKDHTNLIISNREESKKCRYVAEIVDSIARLNLITPRVNARVLIRFISNDRFLMYETNDVEEKRNGKKEKVNAWGFVDPDPETFVRVRE